MGAPIEVKQLTRAELSRVAEIDRTEHIILHVSQAFRATGIGCRLSDELDRIARDAGDTAIVVSATPSENTVRFYLRRGYQPMAQALPELYELEPEDVHMRKAL